MTQMQPISASHDWRLVCVMSLPKYKKITNNMDLFRLDCHTTPHSHLMGLAMVNAVAAKIHSYTLIKIGQCTWEGQHYASSRPAENLSQGGDLTRRGEGK